MMKMNAKIQQEALNVITMNFSAMIKPVFHHSGSMNRNHLIKFIYKKKIHIHTNFIHFVDNLGAITSKTVLMQKMKMDVHSVNKMNSSECVWVNQNSI